MFTPEEYQTMLVFAIKNGKDIKRLNRKWVDDYKRNGDNFYVSLISKKIKQYQTNKKIVAVLRENI